MQNEKTKEHRLDKIVFNVPSAWTLDEENGKEKYKDRYVTLRFHRVKEEKPISPVIFNDEAWMEYMLDDAAKQLSPDSIQDDVTHTYKHLKNGNHARYSYFMFEKDGCMYEASMYVVCSRMARYVFCIEAQDMLDGDVKAVFENIIKSVNASVTVWEHEQ